MHTSRNTGKLLLSPRSGTHRGCALWAIVHSMLHGKHSVYVCMYTIHTFSLTHRMLINIHKSKKCLCECNKYYNTAIPHCSHIRREIFSTLLSHVSRTQVYCVLAQQTRNSIVDQFKNHVFFLLFIFILLHSGPMVTEYLHQNSHRSISRPFLSLNSLSATTWEHAEHAGENEEGENCVFVFCVCVCVRVQVTKK